VISWDPLEQEEGIVSSALKSGKIDVDLEFEWLLCLASALRTAQRFRPAEVVETRRPDRLQRIKSHLLERQTDKAPKVVRPRRPMLEIAY
jgi:hypothetical protein